MNIALITERFDIALGGAERSVWEIAEQFRKTGQKVTLLASVAPPDVEGVVSLCGSNPRKRVAFACYCSALEQHLKNVEYDIVHSTLPLTVADVYQPMGGSYIETYIRNAASYSNKLLAMYKRATFFANVKRMHYLRAEKRVCDSTTTVIAALSGYVKNQYERHFRLPETRIAMTPNGVCTDLDIDPEECRRCEHTVVSTLGADRKHTTLLLFAANNFRLKGLRDLLVAMGRFKQRTPSRRLALIVAGSGRQGPYRTLAETLNIGRDVYFTGYTSAIQHYLAFCDAAVLPSYYDPCSRFILEGLALAKPVLTTRYNGACDFYRHLRHGVILDEPNRIEPFVHGLTALSQPENRLAMAEAIRQDNLKQSVSIAAHCRALMNLYQSILLEKQKKQ